MATPLTDPNRPNEDDDPLPFYRRWIPLIRLFFRGQDSSLRDTEPNRANEDDKPLPFYRRWIPLIRILLRRQDSSLRDTIEELIEEQEENEESLAANERILLTNILKLRNRPVEDCKVPRADIFAIDITTPFSDVIKKFAEAGHSRLPVYRKTLDDVVGIIHIKDIMACIAHNSHPHLERLVRQVEIVAPRMLVLDLLLQMRQTHRYMALVVDEFGGIDGLLTIEDLVEEIVGEIQDEHDATLPRLIPRPDGTLMADARVPIEIFEQHVGSILETEEREEVDTLAGLVFSLARRVPTHGEILRHSSGIEFEIIEADPRRIKTLLIRNLPVHREENNTVRE